MWKFKEVDRVIWNKMLSRVEHCNLLQSWEYGDARCNNKSVPIRLVAYNDHDQPKLMLQVLTRTLPLIGGIARINRGPLWINKQRYSKNRITNVVPVSQLTLTSENDDVKPTEQDIENFLNLLIKEAKKRRWWQIRLALECDNSYSVDDILNSYNFKKQAVSAWGSHLISLADDEKKLRTNLKGKWRNLLNKSEKNGVVSNKELINELTLSSLVNSYESFQEEKGFIGLPSDLIRQLANQYSQFWNFNIYTATYSNKPNHTLGFLVTIGSGNTSTYLIGLTNKEDRTSLANYNLLWHAVLDAKKQGYLWFDLGGVNDDTTDGIAHFKSGLSGIPYLLIGEWRWSIF